jgi:hypothetical protein
MLFTAVVNMLDARSIVTVSMGSLETQAIRENWLVASDATADMLNVRSNETGAIWRNVNPLGRRKYYL